MPHLYIFLTFPGMVILPFQSLTKTEFSSYYFIFPQIQLSTQSDERLGFFMKKWMITSHVPATVPPSRPGGGRGQRAACTRSTRCPQPPLPAGSRSAQHGHSSCSCCCCPAWRCESLFAEGSLSREPTSRSDTTLQGSWQHRTSVICWPDHCIY